MHTPETISSCDNFDVHDSDIIRTALWPLLGIEQGVRSRFYRSSAPT